MYADCKHLARPSVHPSGVADIQKIRSYLILLSTQLMGYSKTCVERPLSKRPFIVLKTNYRLKQGSILQYLNDNWSLRSLFCLFLSARFKHVLLCLILS